MIIWLLLRRRGRSATRRRVAQRMAFEDDPVLDHDARTAAIHSRHLAVLSPGVPIQSMARPTVSRNIPGTVLASFL
jgi:hypothetical protein